MMTIATIRIMTLRLKALIGGSEMSWSETGSLVETTGVIS